MRELKITGCKDSSMWYAGLVGQRVPFLREDLDCYLSREPAGYVNIVKKADAELVGHESEPVGIFNGPVVLSAPDVVDVLGSGPLVVRLYAPFELRANGQPAKGEKVQRYKDTKAKW